MPQLTVDGKINNGVLLQALKIEVKVCGTVARTTWQMTFRNITSRILEGSLDFPLKNGLSISRYALDINGKMREAVPVDRSKGTEVFETIQRRRVDPGLLEKVDGNTFRTRIYPINPNSTRTVLIGYEEELTLTANNALKYYLPLNLKDTVADFNLDLSVIQSATQPVFDSSLNENLQFTSSNKQYNAALHTTNYVPGYSIAFNIPKPSDAAEVMLQEFENSYYFLINTGLEKKERAKPLPTAISLLWDASLSGTARNTTKEINLLDAYFKKVNNATINFIVFSNTIKNTKTFNLQNGDWGELKKTIAAIQYDGATNLGNLNLKNIKTDEFILVSDGHQTLGNKALELNKKPVYCINSAVAADYSNLNFIAAKTGGVVIDLQSEKVAEALNKLINEPFRFLGIKQNDFTKEHYPSMPVVVSNNFTVAGIADAGIKEITLQFGYGNAITYEKTIAINTETQLCENFDITKVFAQKKIADLDIQYEQNKQQIEMLGKRFGIVTRNTSLIVLETLNDYIQYEIDPPAELREEYNRIMKQRGGNIITRKQNDLKKSLDMLAALKEWYDAKTIKKEVVAVNNPAPVRNMPAQRPAPVKNAKVISGRITDTDGTPIAFGTVKIKGKNTGTSADANGSYSISVKEGDVIEVNAMGYRSTERVVAAPVIINPVLEKANQTLNEVVVVGYSSQKRKEITGSVQTVNNYDLKNLRETNITNELAGRVSGLQVESQLAGTSGAASNVRIRGAQFIEDPSLNAATFDYIKALKQTEKANRYLKYLELRPYYTDKPTYFFEVASYFLKTGDKANGLTILTNLAELENGSYELYKMLGYKLKEAGDYEAELSAFTKVLRLRTADPQSYRDCALAYADLGNYQQAIDMLYDGMTKSYSSEMNRMYHGIEEIFLTEINRIFVLHKKELNLKKIDKEIIAPMPTDIRVVMNWNKNNSDIDLWVTDPNGEKCFYSHKSTEIGGRISDDFTEGFGPEQFMLKTGIKGKYRIQINYYADRQVTIAGPTTVMAEIYLHYGTDKEEKKIVTLQMEKGKEGEVFIGEVEL